MPSCQRLLADLNNRVASATLTASSTRAATDQVFRQPTARTGNGIVTLSGDYTGANDAQIELEIQTASGATARITQPVFSGAGNGAMTALTAADGAASQDVTVTLVDQGTTTTAAQAILYGDLLLRARSTGTGGNSITLSITPNLTLSTAPIGALAEALARETQEWSDQRLDFGSLPLNPDGTLSAGCPRLVFGRDTSRVYRHYKRWDGDQWQYGVSPKLAAAYGMGAQVHTVTGDYTVTVTNGVTTESVSGTTLYAVLLALSASTLIEVVGVIANDQRPGGQAAIDLPIRTSAFALPVVKARDDMPDLIDMTVAATAPTEVLMLECVNADAINAETWAVQSKVVGALPYATTGMAYDGPYVDFTVPQGAISDRPVAGSITLSATDLEGAGTPKAYPSICFYKPTLGAAAVSKTLTLVWTARPPEDCPCESVAVTGRPSETYLGVDLGNDAMTTLTAGHQSRLEALISWHKTFVAGNTEVTASGELRAADLDLQLAQLAVDELADCLTDLYGADATLAAPARANSTAYPLYQVVEPATRNNYRYRCTVAGTSGSSPPTWPTTIGNTVTDGGVTWICASKIPEIAWDDVLSGVNTDLTSLATLGAENVAPFKTYAYSTAYSLGDIVFNTVNYFKVITAGTTGTTGPTGALPIGQQYLAGTALLQVISKTEAYALKGGENTDITWIDSVDDDPGILRDPQTWGQRYLAACNYVRTLAGLLPKADAGLSPITGSDVWSDPGDAYYWVIQGTPYLPVFNNRYYHSCRRCCGATAGQTDIESTYEFGFAIQVGCPERLVVGDTITIVIVSEGSQGFYKVGDTYQIPLVMGGPLAFSGGVTGTDTLTWTVYSSAQGMLDPYPLTALEPAYSDGGIGFTIHRGAMDFALGDAFHFAVEAGGRFRWRRTGSAWSADTAIADTALLSEGLSAAFTPGPAPSFVAGDLYLFQVRQPYSPAHVQSADGQTWQWTGASATLTVDFGASATIECLGVLRHGLSAGATVTLTLQDAGGAPLYTFTPTIRPGPLLIFPATPVVARRLVITLGNASGQALGWVYAGTPWAATYSADECLLRRAYALERNDGLNPASAYLGAGRSGELRWNHWFTAADWTALLAVIDDVKARGDAPVVVVPNLTDVQDAALVRIATDLLEITDEYRFQDPAARQISLTLPLAAVIV